MEVCLLLAGVLAVGIWAWSHVRMAVFQSWGNRVLDRRINGRSATASPKSVATPKAQPSIENGALIGRLTIPRLHVRAVVREGAGQDTLDVALGHIPGTALPGQSGNVGVAGHRDTLFRGLRKIEKNDVIEFQTPAGNYNYTVESMAIVKPDNVSVLDSSQHPEITLVTCYPFNYVGSAPKRFVVKARLVGPATTSSTGLQRPNPTEDREARPATLAARQPGIRKVNFRVSRHHTRELTPGILLGLTWTDPVHHRANGWLRIARARRTIWLRNQAAYEPVFFRARAGNQQHELTITSVTKVSVTGYLSSQVKQRHVHPTA